MPRTRKLRAGSSFERSEIELDANSFFKIADLLETNQNIKPPRGGFSVDCVRRENYSAFAAIRVSARVISSGYPIGTQKSSSTTATGYFFAYCSITSVR